MDKKISELLGSVRFWFVTLGAIVALLHVAGVISQDVQAILLAWLGTVTGIGTLDSVAEKFSTTKKTTK